MARPLTSSANRRSALSTEAIDMDAASLMDRQYRYQRYVYDLSRKYYLLGRDTILQEMDVRADEAVLEIGCGTARNLLKLAYRLPQARLFGMDASDAMLNVARHKMRDSLYKDTIILRQGLAEQVSPRDFGLNEPFDHILFSYVLSMLPGWQQALERSLQILKPGGYVHIVDFSDQQAMPSWFRGSLLQWLKWFHVHPDPSVPLHLEQLAGYHQDQLRMRHLAGRYALLAHYRKSGSTDDKQSKLTQIPQYLDF